MKITEIIKINAAGIVSTIGLAVLGVAAATGAYYCIELAVHSARLEERNYFYRRGLVKCELVEQQHRPKLQDRISPPVSPQDKE